MEDSEAVHDRDPQAARHPYEVDWQIKRFPQGISQVIGRSKLTFPSFVSAMIVIFDWILNSFQELGDLTNNYRIQPLAF
jgi:hypothetical protein